MTAYPFSRVTPAQFKALKAKAAAKKEKRKEKARLMASNRAEMALPGAKRSNRRPTSRKRLIAKLDAIFSIFVRLRGKNRTGGLCELCGKRPIEVCFHWVSRGDYATRWDPENAVATCRGDNYEETFRKRKYREMHIARVGLEAREALEAKARAFKKYTDADLMELAQQFKEKTEALLAGSNRVLEAPLPGKPGEVRSCEKGVAEGKHSEAAGARQVTLPPQESGPLPGGDRADD